MTGAVRLDLHVHSSHSPDSQVRVEDMVRGLPNAGLSGFALTDHNTIAGHGELAELAARFPQYLLIPGVEVSTRDGHLLLWGVRELPPLHRPVEETIEWGRAHGAVGALAHPFRRIHGVGEGIANSATGVAVEVLNGHSSRTANVRAERVAATRRLSRTAGGDVHRAHELGRAYTEFPEGTSTVAAVLEAIATARTRTGGRSPSGFERIGAAARTFGSWVARGARPL